MTGLKLADIEVFTSEYAKERQTVVDLAETMRREMEEIKRRHIVELKKRVQAAAEKKHRLQNALEANKDLFKNTPRTQVYSGIKVGFQKQTGTIEWDTPEKVVELIRKQFPDSADSMIVKTETPIKKSLEQLSVQELKSIGCKLENTGDKMILKPVDAKVDKLVEDLLRDDPTK